MKPEVLVLMHVGRYFCPEGFRLSRLVFFTPNRRTTYGVVGNTKKTAFPNTLCSRSHSSAAAGACRFSWGGPLPPENVFHLAWAVP